MNLYLGIILATSAITVPGDFVISNLPSTLISVPCWRLPLGNTICERHGGWNINSQKTNNWEPDPNYWQSETTLLKPPQNIPGEKQSLEELYQDALAEGGNLIVYCGGDSPGQLDGFRNAFLARFPKISMELIIDFSKNQNARVDLQLERNTLIPDVVQLQTVQDFPRWKAQGDLLQYKPLGWDAVFPQFKDVDGYYTGIFINAFSNVINARLLPNPANWPIEACDYLRPEFNGKIVATYPNDDDAVLFWFKLVVDKYGFKWVEDFFKNNITFVRGTQYPSDSVNAGQFAATFTTDGPLTPDPNSESIFVLPKYDPFVSWAQLAAIMKKAKNPASAKLYLSWILDRETQRKRWYQWSVRRDVPPPNGYRSIFEYPGQTDPVAFATFMEDRATVERFKTQISLIVGEVKGESPTGNLGTHPFTSFNP